MPPKPSPKPGKAAEKDAKDGDKDKDELETHLTMLIASTFANDQLESKRQTLNQYYEIASRQKGENARLREEMMERDRDSLQVVDFLRREVEKKQELIESLKTQVDDQKERAAEALRDREEELLSTIAVKDQLLDDKEIEIKKLEAELESVAKHKRDKHEMEDLITSLKDDLLTTKEKYERELSKLRFQSLEEKVRLKNEEKSLNEKFSHAVNQKAMELLDGQTRSIHSENTELRLYHHKLEKEFMQLSKQSKVLEDEKKKKEREIELSKQSVEEYSRQSYRSHKEIRDLTSRNQQLEVNAAKLVRQFEASTQSVLEEKNGEISQLQAHLREAQQALKVRSIELFRIRRLARIIVQQRSELEMFFTEALEYVKQQLATEKLGKRDAPGGPAAGRIRVKAKKKGPPFVLAGAGTAAAPSEFSMHFASGDFKTVIQESADDHKLVTPSGSELPPILNPTKPDTASQGGRSLGSSAGENRLAATPVEASLKDMDRDLSTADGRIDVSDLSWADKERVLRILFAKISSSQGARRNESSVSSETSSVKSASHTPQPLLEDKSKTFITQQL
ncbi:hypothetical protein DIPPA_00018 [Diplonema papillatum]|nr:hypothetical protein DIPPA_00018 [Diplonema papillatum]